jgi:hypothetical protein
MTQIPMSGWTADQKLAEVGRYVQLTVENDMEGSCIMTIPGF